MVALDIVIVITITAVIQSLFGIGVLLFGTPLLLILGYDFITTLTTLLPISAAINFLQVTKDYKKIDFGVLQYILFFTVPFIMLFLLFVESISLDATVLIGLFLVVLSLKDHIQFIQKTMAKLLCYNKTYYIFMGIIHGLTNLGGSLLSAKVFHEKLTKDATRATIAISYLTFAIFQIITIINMETSNQFDISNIFYVAIGILLYYLTNAILYQKIQENSYQNLLKLFLLGSGVVLLFQ